MKVVGKLCLFSVLWCAGAAAQTFNMGMETNPSAWTPCVEPACNPGGSGVAASVSISATNEKWLHNSLKLSVTGTDWTNFLAIDKVGATTASSFNSDFWVYLPSEVKSGTYQALEYDIFQFLSPYRFMWGSQCVLHGNWQIWDELNQQWLNTTRACEMDQPGWYHVQWWVHRLDGDSSCQNMPCMYYDMLGVNGIYTQLQTTEPAGQLLPGWANDSGLNFQLDISGAKKSATISEYLQKVNLIELGN